jgi:hypothetical protein
MRIAGRGVLCALLMLIPAVHRADPPAGSQFQRADRWEFGWAVPPTTYLNYAVTFQKRIDPPKEVPEGVTLVDPNFDYAHFLGYEVNATGDLQCQAAPLVFVEALLQPALHSPEGKQKPGLEWNREWKLDSIYDYPALLLASEYTITGAEQCGNAECVAITGKHSRKPPAKGGDAEGKLRWQTYDLTSTAWYNPETRRMQGALLELHATLMRPGTDGAKDSREDMHWRVRYDLAAEFDSTHSRYLHEKVDKAIEKGVNRVWAMLRGDGSWQHTRHKRGGTALALLTQLMCDVPKDDPRIKQAFTLLKDTEMENTYSVACSLMAYEARYISEEERRAYLSNPDSPPDFKREVSEDDRAEMERLVQWLADNQNQSNPFYNYTRPDEPTGQRFDFSNTQYALLGLAAALRCNIRIPPGTVRQLVEELIKYQQPTGPKIRRVVGYKPPERDKEGKEGRSTMSSRASEARGWTYARKAKWDKYSEDGDAYGSMTTAGITCLLAGLDIAHNMTPEDFKAEFGSRGALQQWEKRVNDSLDDGMAWMEHWFSVTRNPNKGRHWYLYYMYGLERIMMMAQMRYLGTHNWYNEGAAVLVVTQDENGGWGNLADTCFALLFLKKGTVPSRRRVITGD